MNTPKSFKHYHGCIIRFQGCLDISANLSPGEWTEVVGKKGKRMRCKRTACSVALGPSNNQAGTNLRSVHAGPMSHVMSGGATKFEFLLLDSPILVLVQKGQHPLGMEEETPQRETFEAWQQEGKGEA
jgi:hypothetical protein